MRMTFTYVFIVCGRSQKYWLSEGTDDHVWEKSRGRCDWNLFGGEVFSFFVQKCFFEDQNVSWHTHGCNAVGVSASKWGRCLSLSTSIQYQWYCNEHPCNLTSVMTNYPVYRHVFVPSTVYLLSTHSPTLCMNKANIYSIYLNIKISACIMWSWNWSWMNTLQFPAAALCLLLFLHFAGNVYLQLNIEEPIYPNISATLLL